MKFLNLIILSTILATPIPALALETDGFKPVAGAALGANPIDITKNKAKAKNTPFEPVAGAALVTKGIDKSKNKVKTTPPPKTRKTAGKAEFIDLN